MHPLLHVLGLMVAALGAAMLPPALLDLADGDPGWRVFALPGGLAGVMGCALALVSHRPGARISLHDTFLLTVSLWTLLALVAAAPFALGGMSFTDSVFESMSGLTTTGATVMSDLDSAPRGLLLWRALLQWIGGIGIIVTAIAVLPTLGVGGMQLFQLESSDASGKFLPRVSQIARQTAFVYLGLTVLCALLYARCGMSTFDAVAHAMTTVSAGGFSTSDHSFAAVAGDGADLVAIAFMLLAALPFGLMVLAVRGDFRPLFTDPQPRLFLIIAASAVAVATASLAAIAPEQRPDPALRIAAFNVVSVLTGTGYSTTNYNLWGPFIGALFMMLMFCGGCAGSASCGVKTFRLHISALALAAHVRSLNRPGRVVPVRYGERVVDENTIRSIELFMGLYLSSFAILACALALTGLDAATALSAAAASLGNVGPGLGEIVGPTGNYGPLPTVAKWLCVAAMLLGRLELIAAFVVLSPRYWYR